MATRARPGWAARCVRVTHDSRTDAELLAATLRDDGSAFGVLVRRHIRSATLLAAQLLGDRDDAEDIVQEAFTVVLRKARRFDHDRPFPPWLFAIVRRLATNRRLRDVRRARLLHLWRDWNVSRQGAGDMHSALFARLDATAVRRAMK